MWVGPVRRGRGAVGRASILGCGGRSQYGVGVRLWAEPGEVGRGCGRSQHGRDKVGGASTGRGHCWEAWVEPVEAQWAEPARWE